MTTYQQGSTATLSVQWLEYSGGPPSPVTGVTITITAVSGGAPVLGPTSTGVTNPATGLNVYSWAIPSGLPIGDYVVVWNGTDPDTDPVQASEIVTVAVLPGTPYSSRDMLKLSLSFPLDAVDPDEDERLDWCRVKAAKRIDLYCGRRMGFGQQAEVTYRYYTPRHPEILLVDDISTETGLVIATGTAGNYTDLTVGEWLTYPDNAIDDGWPIEQLRHVYALWPVYWPGYKIRVGARYGWPAVPDPVAAAHLLESARLRRRMDSPDGVAGIDAENTIQAVRTGMDPDARFLLDDADGLVKAGLA